MTVHVFVGSFASEAEAAEYSEAQWEPEPDSSVSDAEYAAWEDRNPSWRLRTELGAYLDSDFIETIWGPDRYKYLSSMLADKVAAEKLAKEREGFNTLVLVYSQVLGGFDAQMKSTAFLTYCGEFPCDPIALP